MSTLIQEKMNQTKQESLFPTPYSAADKMVISNGIKHFITEHWTIPYPVRSRYLRQYQLLYWQGDYLLTQLQAGRIIHNDTEFIVLYHKQLTRGKILENKHTQYALSFRQAELMWNLPAFVLISDGGNYHDK